MAVIVLLQYLRLEETGVPVPGAMYWCGTVFDHPQIAGFVMVTFVNYK